MQIELVGSLGQHAYKNLVLALGLALCRSNLQRIDSLCSIKRGIRTMNDGAVDVTRTLGSFTLSCRACMARLADCFLA